MHRLFHNFLIAAGVAALAAPKAPEVLRGEALMAELGKGGYTVVLRHARTDRSYNENVMSVPTLRTQQRNLNDDGVKDARLMGVVFKKYAIPFGELLSSPMYRCTETTEYATGSTPTTSLVLRAFPTGEDARKLLAIAPKAGTNRLIVTHHFIIETHVPGIKPGDIGESEAAVIRTTADGKIELVGKILLADWTELAGTATTTSSDNGGFVAAVHKLLGLGGQQPAGAAEPASGFAPPVYPDNVVGKLAQSYVKAFSSGDTTEMRRFIESSLEVDAKRPTAERLASYTKLFGDLGPLMVVGVQVTNDHEVLMMAHAKKGGAMISVKESETQKGRASSVTLRYNQ